MSNSYQSLLRGKGYDPEYKTSDKDLIIPERFRGDEEEKEPPPDVEVDAVVRTPKEPDRRPRGLPRAHGPKWEDANLPTAPEGWSPRGDH